MNDNTLITLEPAGFLKKKLNMVLSGLLRPLRFVWWLTWLISSVGESKPHTILPGR